MWIQVCCFLSAQSSPTAKPNCFSKLFLKHSLSFSISPEHLPPELLVPSSSFSSTPGSSRPLTSGATLWRDSEVWQLFAELRSCWSPLRRCLPPCPSPAGKALGLAAVGSWQPAQQSAGQAGGREPETDLIKGRRPGGDRREGDTHLNNSGANKSFRLGSVQDVRRGWILMYFRLPSMQNVVLLNNPTLTNQRYFKSIPHKVNEESGYAWVCIFIALGWNSIMWGFWELQVWPLQVGCWNRYSIFWSQIVHRTFSNWRKVMDQMYYITNIGLSSLHL